MRTIAILMSAALGFNALTANAAELKVGDPAPALQIADWVKGEPVDLRDGDGDHIYVVEFWATWCGPCKESIPLLTKLQSKYENEDVRVIGISDESKELVESFVEDMGDKMGYTVACDDKRGTHSSYMLAAGQETIPTAFLITKEKRIAWIGDPRNPQMDSTLDALVKGTFDIEEAKQAATAQAVAQASPVDSMPELKIAGLHADKWWWKWAAIVGFTGMITVICFKNPKRTHS